ncbi:MAG: MOSC domain-containing protein [Actinomycetota bacterium]|jgi:hypothetical protein|nr:MOSC domain-containing protein [Actinomycetota bacterium]
MSDHLTVPELEALAAEVRTSPADRGVIELIVARPGDEQRRSLDEGELDSDVGLVGDNWNERPSSRADDGGPHPDMQLNIINSRFSEGIARGDHDQRILAGDQLHVDFDLSETNIPPWTKLAIGDAVIEITDQPHTGCAKFVRRFGLEAQRFTGTEVGKELHLRGVNARVHTSGTIRRGDTIHKL